MESIKSVDFRDEQTIIRLMNVWESSVKATHAFLSKDNIENLKPYVKCALGEIKELYSFSNDENIICGFIGIEEEKIEMLFIDDAYRRQGIGKKLLSYGIDVLKAKYVDVNEQNIQGAHFYKHLRFEIIGRDELDSQGNPFPILHLKISK